MKNVYDQVPTFENEKYMLRFIQIDDAKELLEVYSDKNALPFFNSDNCHGDNFYSSGWFNTPPLILKLRC